MESARTLFREYQEWLDVDLCFQDFDEELKQLPGAYASPMGRLFLLRDRTSDTLVGCAALRPESQQRCEMKRLYVRKEWRGLGLGRDLAELCLKEAVHIGYQRMCLDTIGSLEQARALYGSLGFTEVPAYYANPLENVVFMEIDLRTRI